VRLYIRREHPRKKTGAAKCHALFSGFLIPVFLCSGICFSLPIKIPAGTDLQSVPAE
jgi:hypothetical protein